MLLAMSCSPPEPNKPVEPAGDVVAREALSFVGAHVFDLLNKLETEAASDPERRQITRAVLDDAEARGVSVLRFWGSLKRVGVTEEVNRSVRLLNLVLEENARRRRPLRFIVTLLNHQAGYGAPDPSRSLDDQAAGPWHARTLYLQDGWRAPGVGSLAERIAALSTSPAAHSEHVLAWELVNELDTFRHISGGRFDGPDAETLVTGFIVPAAEMLAGAVSQSIMIGDLRGERAAYAAWAPGVIAALPPALESRLIWTSHVYSERGRDPEAFMGKLDVDLELARAHDLPFVLGELGEHAPGAPAGFCTQAVRHDFEPLFAAVRRRDVRAIVVWGEGRCDLRIGTNRSMAIGAGADSAEIRDPPSLELLRRLRPTW